MDTRNLARADIRYIDALCRDDGAIDTGGGLERALERFGERHGIDLAPGEIYAPTQAQFFEITKLTVNEITGGYPNV